MRVKNFEIKELNEETGTIEGYLSTYGNTDREGDIFIKGAFKEDVGELKVVPMLYNHDRNSVIGKMELKDSEQGLLFKGSFNLKDEKAKNIFDLVVLGALKHTSVGFQIKDYEPVDKKRPFGGWKILQAEVYEGSIATIPANPQATINTVKTYNNLDYYNEHKKDLKLTTKDSQELNNILKTIKEKLR